MAPNDDITRAVEEIVERNEAIHASRPPSSRNGTEIETEPDTTRPIPGEHKKVILIIEDEIDIRTIIADILEDAGYRVKQAMHGAEALEMLNVDFITSQYVGEPQVPDLILLDLMLPVMDGPAFFAELRKHPAFDSVPVVVMSADSRIHQFQDWCVSIEGLALTDPKVMLKKPFVVKELLRKVQRAINGEGA